MNDYDDEDPVVHEVFFTGEDGFDGAHLGKWDAGPAAEELRRLTFCILITRHGFVSVGWSITGNALAYDEHVGRTLAKSRAELRLRGRREPA